MENFGKFENNQQGLQNNPKDISRFIEFANKIDVPLAPDVAKDFKIAYKKHHANDTSIWKYILFSIGFFMLILTGLIFGRKFMSYPQFIYSSILSIIAYFGATFCLYKANKF
jgi:hypothetical protein